MGLTENVDYVLNNISVTSGVISQLTVENIPEFDESRFYYTNENTSFSINKSSVTAGLYLMVRGYVEFKELFASQISNVKLIIDLPTACEYVDGSMIIGITKAGILSEMMESPFVIPSQPL